jgi:hypothetical protein
MVVVDFASFLIWGGELAAAMVAFVVVGYILSRVV